MMARYPSYETIVEIIRHRLCDAKEISREFFSVTMEYLSEMAELTNQPFPRKINGYAQ